MKVGHQREAPSLAGTLACWRQWVVGPSAESPPSAPAKQVFRSADMDEIRHAIAQVFAEHQMNLVGPGHRLDAAFAAWDLGTVAISYIRHGAEVIIRPGRLESFYAVSTPVKGSAISRFGRDETESAPQSAVVHPPTQEIAMRWSADCENVALRIDRCALEAELSCMLRRDIDAPVMFEPAMNLSARTTSSWAATLGFVLDEIRRGTGSLDHPLVRSRVEQLFIDQLLLAQPHNYSEQLRTGHPPARPPAVRRAMELIHAHAADPLTVPMLAELAEVSVRSLQQGFRDHLGITPLEYLRQVRLARARDDLHAAGPDGGTSVTEVAYRWGFGHLGRFTVYYKHRYGELPSETLRWQ